MDDNSKRFAYNDDTSHLYLFDVSLNEKKPIFNSSPDHLYFSPIVSPDGHYVGSVIENGGPTKKPGAYTIIVVDLLSGDIEQIPFENRLKGDNLIVPGMIRWFNDSSGFTYHRTRFADNDLKAEICVYDIESNNTNVMVNGIGGLPSPRTHKLLWMKPGDRKTLYATHTESERTYTFTWNHNIIDYTWCPEGENVAVVVDGLMSGKVIIADDELCLRHTIDTGQPMRQWDSYFVPMRWLPLNAGAE